MVLFNHKVRTYVRILGGVNLVEKLFEYLGNKTTFAIFCKIGSFQLKLYDVVIVDIEKLNNKIIIYFNDDDNIVIYPDEYTMDEECSEKYVKENGDYILLIEEVEEC